MKKYILYIFLFTLSIVNAQEEVSVSAEIDTTQIRIGEQFQYKISVGQVENVSFPELKDLGKLEVVSSGKIDTLKSSLVKKYLLTGFDSGSFYVPKQEVFLKDKAYYTDSLLIQVATVAVDTLKQKPFGIKPIVEEPLIFDDYKPYFIWLWLLLALVIIGGVLYYFYRKYYKEDEEKAKPLIPPYQEAIEKFADLEEKQLWQNDKIKEYYTELTEIVRVYIGREIEIHTLEATTDEMIDLVTHQNQVKEIGISKEAITKIEAFLKHADFVKFAKLRPMAEEIQGDRSVAKDIVENLQPIVNQYQVKKQELEAVANPQAQKEVSPHQKRNRKLLYIAAFVIIAIALTITAYQIFKVPGNDTASQTEKGIESNNWEAQPFGNPALILDAPFKIPLQTNEIPQQVKSVMKDFQVYEYSKKGIDVAVTFIEYAPEIKPDIETIIQSEIQGLQDSPKIEDFEYEREPVTFDDNSSAVKILGKMKEDGNEKKFHIVGIARENKIWQVSTSCNANDEENNLLIETLLNSIKIEKE